MKLRINRETHCSQEELRTLLIDVADQLAGDDYKVLESKLPWEGYPILLADAELHPVLVSFDTGESQTALLNGLMAAEKLSSALAWVNQVYDVLGNQQRPPRLVVVSEYFPPGATAILSSCSSLRLFQFKTLSVNGETGLWLEPLRHPACTVATVQTEPRPRMMTMPVTETSPPAEEKLPDLSNEEISYFQQL